MRILVDPTASKDEAAYEEAAKALERRGRGALLTAIRSDGGTTTSAHWHAEDGPAVPPLPHSLHGDEKLRECLAAGKVELLHGTDAAPVEVLVEPVVPAPLLLIIGGGHVGQALAAQAALIGFDTMVLDDRAEYADPALFPTDTVTQCGDVARTLGAQAIGADTYIVIVTRGHQHDAQALRACIREPAAYIGMIGSRRKVSLLREEFVEAGWATEEEFDRVFAPIGVDIGAETVPEIATSIAAQLIAVRREGRAPAMAKGAMPR